MFSLALQSLAVGAGPIHERLLEACRSSLNLIEESDVPLTVAEHLATLKSGWGTSQQLNVWARSLSQQDAQGVAVWVFDTYTELGRQLGYPPV
jgi:hypothetical protein